MLRFEKQPPVFLSAISDQCGYFLHGIDPFPDIITGLVIRVDGGLHKIILKETKVILGRKMIRTVYFDIDI